MEPADGGKQYNTINNSDDPPKSAAKLRGFWPIFILFNILLISALFLISFWRAEYGGGFDWSISKLNFHPVFMCLGFLAMYAYGMIIYRLLRNAEKMFAKIVHTVIHLSAIIFICIGLYCVWGSKNLTSLHSWIAFGTVLLFIIQWLLGFVTFLFPGLSGGIKAWYKPNHVFWGVAIFGCALASILTGLAEMASEVTAQTTEAYIVNSFALLTLGTGIAAAYLTCQPDYAREA